MGHRISSLPIAEYCGRAPAIAASLDYQIRAGVMGSWFHAWCDGDDKAPALFKSLTDEEQEEVLLWQKPSPTEICGVVLEYAHADKELAVGLRGDLTHTEHSAEDAITSGTLDFAWCLDVVESDQAIPRAFVVDIKRTRWTSETDTLQLHAYGMAYASLRGCQAYTPGLYIAEEGRYVWGPTIDLYSLDAAVIADRIVHAATNDSATYRPGAHCRGCWSRLHCPQYLLPPELAESSLAPFCEPGALNPGNALSPLLLAQRAKETAEQVIAQCKAVALRNGGIYSEDGKKVWRATISPGKESVSAKSLRAQLGQKADQYITTGKPFEKYQWVNAK